MAKKKRGKKKTKRVEREWGECECCGQFLPILPMTGMCGVCTFGTTEEMLVEHDDLEVP